tara:strand:+ start:23 stop:463 length:441 start_codon:yes stop_codon:yes gene_type:complete
MKKNYAKIDRSTGDVVDRKNKDNPRRALNKPFVWLEEVRNNAPVHDKETHKAVPVIEQPDLSDLGIPVPVTAKRVFSFNIVALSAQELQDNKIRKIASTDHLLARIVEDILVNVATKGSVGTRDDYPAKVWTKINNRRALRGKEPV